MRPVKRGDSPITGDYTNYKDAKTELISRVGSGWVAQKHLASYCSYCERKIETMLAVEHIEPKDGPYGKPHLIGSWKNFLLACVNCNSTKKDKPVILDDLFSPDRDNTFAAFEYLPDGNVIPASNLTPTNRQKALDTLALTGLDKAMRQSVDQEGRLIAEDRASQRMQVWGIAEVAKGDIDAEPNNDRLKRQVVVNAVSNGFFSVWMAVFHNNADMRNRFIEAFAGTRASGCFDPISTLPVSPAPNPDVLPHGGKI